MSDTSALFRTMLIPGGAGRSHESRGGRISVEALTLVPTYRTRVTAGIWPRPATYTPGPAKWDGDPHLRSVAAVTGYHIQASDGEIGHVEDFLR
jgi:hypothetical protein